jgi:hypothetical protein
MANLSLQNASLAGCQIAPGGSTVAREAAELKAFRSGCGEAQLVRERSPAGITRQDRYYPLRQRYVSQRSSLPLAGYSNSGKGLFDRITALFSEANRQANMHPQS